MKKVSAIDRIEQIISSYPNPIIDSMADAGIYDELKKARAELAPYQEKENMYLSFAAQIGVAAEYGRDDKDKCFDMILSALEHLQLDKEALKAVKG